MNDYDLSRQQHKEDSKKKIIEAAISLFGKNGYVKTSIKDIAEKAGVANGLVSKYYETKEILLTESYRYATSIAYPVIDVEIKTTESVKALIQQTIDIYNYNPEFFLFFKTMMNTSDLPEEYTESRRIYFYRAPIYSHIVEVQKKGFLLDMDPHHCFITFMRMVYSLVEIYGLIPHQKDNDIALNTLNLVINSIDERFNNGKE